MMADKEPRPFSARGSLSDDSVSSFSAVLRGLRNPEDKDNSVIPPLLKGFY